MVNKNKAAGTSWEVRLRDFLSLWFPFCERLAIGGTKDKGDLTGVQGWMVEAKAPGGHDTQAHWGVWMTEAEAKAKKFGLWPVVLVKRRNMPVARGFAVIPIQVWAELAAHWKGAHMNATYCDRCGERIATAEFLDHIRVMHPELTLDPERELVAIDGYTFTAASDD